MIRTTPTRGTSSTSGAFAAATPPPTRWPRRSGREPARAGRWSASARRSAPSSPCRQGSTSRHTSGRSTRRSATRRAARSAGPRPPARSAWSVLAIPSATWTRSSTCTRSAGAPKGSFPPTAGGDQSRAFFRRLFELLADDGTVQLHFLAVGGRRIAAGVWFEDAEAWYLYNAGVDPEARELSPGVLLSALAIRAAIAAGRRRFDYLRGDEPYKYEWGAIDEPIQRLLVVRTGV